MKQNKVNQASITLAFLLFSNRVASMFRKVLPIQLRGKMGRSFHLLITIGDLDV